MLKELYFVQSNVLWSYQKLLTFLIEIMNEPTKYCLRGSTDNGQGDDLLKNKTDQDSRQRLQALISEWLRMENLVVLTAAGCSVSSGGKLMSGGNSLEKVVLEAVNVIETLPAGAKTIIAERLKNFEERAEWAKNNFEEWLSYLVNAVYLGKQIKSPIQSLSWKKPIAPISSNEQTQSATESNQTRASVNTEATTEDVEVLIGYIAKAIYAECALLLPDNTADSEGEKAIAPHLAFLSKLIARDSNLGRTHLFTLNYDTLFEQALELLGVQYFDGFTGRANARFDPSVYGLDIYYPGEIAEGRVRRFDRFLHYYKLHGSIHWRVLNEEIRARHEDISEFVSYRALSSEQKALELVKDKFARNHTEFGILPTSNKFVQTLEMPYSHLFRSLTARLSAPQTFLLVLGYGFGDDHITRIIETALLNPALVMLVVEPNPDSLIVKRILRYKELGKRAFILTPTKTAFEQNRFQFATFDDFAKNIMPDVQWLDDFLRLRRFEKQLQSNSDALETTATDAPNSSPTTGN